MKLKRFSWNCAAIAVALGVLAAPRIGQAQETPSVFDAKQSEAIETLVREYLLENPEVLVEALRGYEQRQQAAEEQRQRAALVAEAEALNRDPDAPVMGNPDGDVTLVEFFDYRCPYCKRMSGPLVQLMEEDPNLRVVMKEFPILSQESVQAARAALAAMRQGQYRKFHFALMDDGSTYSDDEIMALANTVGLDETQLRADMQDPAIENAIRRNHALAGNLGITGTPAFVIGDTLLPGAVSLDQLRALVARVRAEAG
ncbi:MAG: DsbA family protein [Kiloniellaceae bacterium]